MPSAPPGATATASAVVAVAGLATAGTLTATGWLAGQAVGDWSAQHASDPGHDDPGRPGGRNPGANDWPAGSAESAVTARSGSRASSSGTVPRGPG